ENKLVIKIDQVGDRVPKFSVADDISEVYGRYENNCWKDILKGLLIAISSDPSKCSYHILYAPALFIDYHELKAFTELVYIITSEKVGKYIDRGLPDQNFILRLIGSAKKSCIKHIFQFSLDNGWNELDHVRVQLPSSLRLEVSSRILSIEKNNILLRISVGSDILQKHTNLVLQKHFNYLRDWTIEEKDSENFNSDERRKVFECDPSIAEKIQQENKNLSPTSHRIKDSKTYKERYVRPLLNKGNIYVGSPWETGKTYVLEHIIISDDSHLAGQSIEKLYKLIQEARRIIVIDNDLTDLNIEWIKALQTILTELWNWIKQMSLLPFENWKSASLICHFRKDLQEIVRALKTDFPELQIKEYHGKSDPVEKAHDFIGIEVSIIESGPKSEENTLSQVVKAKCSIVKAKEVSDISNATIINHETAELLENKPKKTLERDALFRPASYYGLL
ncbi:2557_t:CDS:2, partial [Funneliformis geosporum]